MKLKTTFAIALIFLYFPCKSQMYFPPTTGNTWNTTTPESLGWCVNKIDSLYKFLEDNDSKAFIVLKDGKIVLEKYFGTFVQDSIWYWASAGKTLTAFCVGIAQKEGSLKITDSSSKYLGNGWTSLTPEQEAKITVWNQLTMTSGLNDVSFECTLPSCLTYKADAGTRWAYHNSPYTLLDNVIENATGGNLNLFVTNKIKNQTGIKGIFIKSGYNNVFYSTPRNFARFGLLLLNKGKWDGTDLLQDSIYFKNMTSSSQTLNKSYGYLTWLNGKSSYMLPQSQIVFPGKLCPDAPDDMYAAMGKNGQYLNVSPSQNLVFIRMGNLWNSSNVPNVFNNDIWKKLNEVMCSNSATKKVEQATVKMGPNPSNGKININMEAGIKNVYVYSSDGKLIQKHQTNAQNFEVKIANTGIYFIKIANPENTINFTQKVLVMNQ